MVCCVIRKFVEKFHNWILIVLFATMIRNTKHDPSKTLEDLGYAFNDEGKLMKLDPETKKAGTEPFNFMISEDENYNQEHYEMVGEAITDHVYQLLEEQLHMHKLPVPSDYRFEHRSFVFVTKDVFVNTEKLLVLVHGSGVVRAGQWARSIIINDSLQAGSMVPFIKKAQELGYAVLVTNTNDNDRFLNGKRIVIKGSSSPKEHFDFVWKNYVRDCKCKHVAILAHSYGGLLIVEMVEKYFSEFKERVFAIAFTDSVHSITGQKVSKKVSDFLQKVRNLMFVFYCLCL
ncbi:FAM172 family protein homolog CG10038 isoform X2 [Bacillus rossius redtenbacheri]|uniref:FAM172 family protein homolog CG10038 isoform X2 n=1 Tax=Bacillus rossius redtenbacheri TaxID=93214 RepID=UPI002FDEB021